MVSKRLLPASTFARGNAATLIYGRNGQHRTLPPAQPTAASRAAPRSGRRNW
jgi:hypothetical protein